MVDKITNSNGATVENIEPRVLRQTISESTSAKIRQYCRATVMEEGGDRRTGRTARPAGYAIGGKTGTAETIPRKNGEYVVSFMGYAPADDPQIAIYVVVDRANASPQDDAKFATGIVRNVLTEVLPYLNIFMTEELSEKEIQERGMEMLEKTIQYARSKGLYVVADIKRGDIGSTSEAYAVGHLGKVQVGSKSYYGFDEDFVTVNPYLGSDGVNPFVKICKEEKKGIFVLVKTSNPSSGEFQDQLVNGRPLYELVGEKVAAWGADCMGDSYSYVGAVVGATYPEQGKVLRKVMPKAFILVPGYGAQGGKGADLVHFFNEDGLGAIINSSRGIIAAYQQEKYAQFGEQNYADASRAAVLDMREDIAQALAAR